MTAADSAVPNTAIDFMIDAEFASLCPEYTGQDALGLEHSIRNHGVREPLVIWEEEKILLDGHRRFEICKRHCLKFPIVEYSFPDRGTARNWMIENQLSRRNLTPEQRNFLLGKRYAAEKKEPADSLRRGEASPRGQTDHSGRTAARVAAATGVSEKTVRRAAKFAEDLDRIGESCPEAKAEILAGRTKLTRGQVAAAAKAPMSLAKFRKLTGGDLPRRSKRRCVERIELLSRQLGVALGSYRKQGFPDAELLELAELRTLRETLAEIAASAAPDGGGR